MVDPAYLHGSGRLVLDWSANGNPDAFFICLRDPVTGATQMMAEAEVGRTLWIKLGECWYGVTPTEAAPKMDAADELRVMWGQFPRRHIKLEYTHAFECPCTMDKCDPHYGARKALAVARLKARNQ